MITIIKRGTYQLIDTGDSTKIFLLDSFKAFEWKETTIRYIDYSKKLHPKAIVLTQGKYFLYDVRDEDTFTDAFHLELHLGNKIWQGYLLPDGLPSKKEREKTMFPIPELISKSQENMQFS